ARSISTTIRSPMERNMAFASSFAAWAMLAAPCIIRETSSIKGLRVCICASEVDPAAGASIYMACTTGVFKAGTLHDPTNGNPVSADRPGGIHDSAAGDGPRTAPAWPVSDPLVRAGLHSRPSHRLVVRRPARLAPEALG